MKRRKYLRLAGTVASASIAGCTEASSGSDSVQDSDGDGVIDSEDYAPNDPAVQEKSDVQSDDSLPEFEAGETDTPTETPESDEKALQQGPEPVVIDTETTYPRVVSLDQESRSDLRDKFHVTVQNTGASGQVLVKLFWTTDEAQSIHDAEDTEPGLQSDGVETARERNTYFEEGERRTVSFTAEPPEAAESYVFDVKNLTHKAEIHNTGDSGMVLVELMRSFGGMPAVHSDQTVWFGADETETVQFDLDTKMITSEWKIRASAADSEE